MQETEYFWLATGGGNNDSNHQHSLYKGHRFAIQSTIRNRIRQSYSRELDDIPVNMPIDTGAYAKPTDDEQLLMMEYLQILDQKSLKDILERAMVDQYQLGLPTVTLEAYQNIFDQLCAHSAGVIFRILMKESIDFQKVIDFARRYQVPTSDEIEFIFNQCLYNYSKNRIYKLCQQAIDLQQKVGNAVDPKIVKHMRTINIEYLVEHIEAKFLFWFILYYDTNAVMALDAYRNQKYYYNKELMV